MNEDQFDELIEIIDSLRDDAQDTTGQLSMIDDATINRIRVLCGLPEENLPEPIL